jgi:undecaprenyl-diphosphatase
VLSDLREWLVDWADSPAGPVALALITTAEAIFFPLPPDPLLIALALRNPDAALLLAGLTTVASVGGGLVGHFLGVRFGRPLLQRLHSSKIERVESMFTRYGFWSVAIAGLTPIPYKVFTISAGVFGVPRAPFVLASIVGRGLRFGTFGVAIFLWGDRFETFFEERFDVVVVVLTAGLVVGVAGWLLWSRVQRARARAGGAGPV